MQKNVCGTKGTVFHGCHHAPQTILDCLAMLADGPSRASIHRIKGVKEETVGEWLQRSAQHVEEIEARLVANYPVNRAQLDAPPETTSGTRAKKGAPGRSSPRWFLEGYKDRDRQSAAHRACSCQDGGRSGTPADGPTQRARPSPGTASSGDRWARQLPGGDAPDVGTGP